MAKTALHLTRFDEGSAAPLKYPVKVIPANPSKMHSPQVGNHHNLAPFDFTKYSEWLDEVTHVRLLCGKNEYPTEFLKKYWPKDWGPYVGDIPEALAMAGVSEADVDSCAQIVRMDTPVDLGVFIMRWLAGKGALKPKKGTNHFDFLGTFPAAQAVLATYVSDALKRAFEAKYYFGAARPAQIFEALGKGKRADLMAYPNPTHPSYPAGHGAAAAATAKFFYDYYQLATDDWLEIRRAAYLFAQYRSLAGVHYAVDNLAGLQIGGLEVGYGRTSAGV
jgi:hypothetical protein